MSSPMVRALLCLVLFFCFPHASSRAGVLGMVPNMPNVYFSLPEEGAGGNGGGGGSSSGAARPESRATVIFLTLNSNPKP